MTDAQIANTIERVVREVVLPAAIEALRKELEDIAHRHIVYHVARLHHSTDRHVIA